MSSDHFSGHAADYARFRPGYPPQLFGWLASLTPGHDLAWDCGCGNGQASAPLAEHYAHVLATDLAAAQIAEAAAHPRIDYRAAPAESSGLPAASCDLVTVAQALHWFDFDRFYAEVRRVGRAGGVIAAWTYMLLRADDAIDAVLADFYTRVLGPHWPPERRWVDAAYRGMPFPFEEIPAPGFEIRLQWSIDDLLAYLATWSASQRLVRAEGQGPMNAFAARMRAAWRDPATPRTVVWPIAMRVGRI